LLPPCQSEERSSDADGGASLSAEWSPTKSDGLSDLIVSDPAPQTA
jgi:hypothetical protein